MVEPTYGTFYDVSWGEFTAEIDKGRPVILSVDADGDGLAWHYVVAIGYDNPSQSFAIYNTWDHMVHWYPWHFQDPNEPFGIYDVLKIKFLTGGNVINVPQDYPDIKSAVNAADDGDTVLVAPGVYTGYANSYITWSNKSIVVISEEGPENTIIDCSGYSVCFNIYDVQSSFASLNGFTIRNAGRAIYIIESTLKIENCIITGCTNTSYYYGAITSDGWYSTPTIKNVTICNNRGYGLSSIFYSNVTLINSIIWENLEGEINTYYNGVVNASYSIIRKGFDGYTNLKENPLFIDTYGGNFNVFANSPCIDAGAPGDTDPDNSPADIGAYFKNRPEYYDHGELIYVAINGSDYYGNGSINSPYYTIQKALRTSRHGDTVLVQPGEYYQNFNYYGHNAVVASNFLHSRDRSDIENTILKPQNTASIAAFESFENNTAQLYGFTITNGNAETGAGIYCLHSDPLIAYNHFHSNNADWYGGCIYGAYSDAVLNYNVMNNNSAGVMGGAIYLAFSNTSIDHCTITDNFGQDLTGGIYLWHAPVEITNSIVWGNQSVYMPDIYAYEGAPVISYSNVPDQFHGDDCIYTDPLFCELGSMDYHLDISSPCANYGAGQGFMGALDVGCGEIRTIIVPDTLHVKDADAVVPVMADILMGNFYGDHALGDIDFESIIVNDTIVPVSHEILPEHEGLFGEVYKGVIPARSLINEYMPVWGTIPVEFTVSGQFTDDSPFSLPGILTLIGHIPGDANSDSKVNLLDILYMVDYQYRDGEAPIHPKVVDLDCDEDITVIDILILIDMIYRGFPDPDCL